MDDSGFGRGSEDDAARGIEADLDAHLEGEFLDDEGFEPAPEALAEFAAVADAEADALTAARAAIDEERERTRAVLERYRAALLAAEPELPPELVQGTTLEDLDAAVTAARAAVGGIKARLASEGASTERGFPIGSPARSGPSLAGMSASEKIRRGLMERARG